MVGDEAREGVAPRRVCNTDVRPDESEGDTGTVYAGACSRKAEENLEIARMEWRSHASVPAPPSPPGASPAMSAVHHHLEELCSWLRTPTPNAVQILQARAWAARREGPPDSGRGVGARHPDAALEATCESLLARLDAPTLVRLRASTPTLAALLEALGSERPRASTIRTRVVEFEGRCAPGELDRAARTLGRERGGLFGLLLAQASL